MLCQKADELVDRDLGGGLDRVAGIGAVVGAEDAAREAAQRGVGGQRFLFHDVQRGTVDLATAQPVDQGGLVDQRSAGDVDDPHAGLGPRKGVGVEHVPAAGRQ